MSHPSSQMASSLYPLSSSQKRLWYFSQLEPDSRAYHIGAWLELEGELDIELLQQAMSDVRNQHVCWRLGFTEQDGQPMQFVRPTVIEKLSFEILSKEDDCPENISKLAQQFNGKPYDLKGDYLYRDHLLKVNDERHILLLSMHHIIADASSLSLAMQELMMRYVTLTQGKQLPCKEDLSYLNHTTAEQEWLKSNEVKERIDYWQKTLLADGDAALNLPKKTSLSGNVFIAGRHQLRIDAEQLEQIQEVAKQAGSTLFVILLASLKLTLAKFSGKETVRIGVPAANRKKKFQRAQGFYVNNLPLQSCINAEKSTTQLLQEVSSQLTEMRRHEGLPYDQIKALSSNQQPMFQVAFNYRRFGGGMSMKLGKLTVTPDEILPAEIPFELVFDAVNQGKGKALVINISYGEQLFEQTFIHQLSEAYCEILKQLCDNPQQPLGHYNLLNEQQHQNWQALSRQTLTNYQWDHSQLFTDLVRRHAIERPDAIALIHGAANFAHTDKKQQLSYGELESRSNALANLLIHKYNPQADDIIAVCCERGIDMMIGFIATLKAGAAFLPMDPDYPAERLAFMLSDSGATLILSQKKLIRPSTLKSKPLLNTTLPQLALDEIDYSSLDHSAPTKTIQPQQLAYVIYTSGSTGQPKGVLIPHIGFSMHVQTIGQRYGMTTDDVELLFASISFDGCIERWSVPLAFGSRLVIRDQELWSAETTCQVLEDEEVTISCLPPSYASALLDWIEYTQSQGKAPNLKVRSWTLGGEAFTRELYQRLQSILKPKRLINGYGPTETVVTPTLWDAYSDTQINSAYAPIGTGVGERRLYVLDNNLNPVPEGMAGELYIGEEVGLARGYHQRPDLTAERFLPDPFICYDISTNHNKSSSRMYRTGDRVQWALLADGRTVLDYLGRVDQQIKIRGFRIELGEIEAALHAQPEIYDVAVTAYETPTGKKLVAYCVLDKQKIENANTPNWQDMSTRLAKDLPDYMAPSHYETLEKLPLNPAGKVDRNALPEPDWQQQVSAEYKAPETEQEILLAKIWTKLVLHNVPQSSNGKSISRSDNFFALGGDSIIALQVVSHLKQQGWRLNPKDIFERPVLHELAQKMLAAEGKLIDQSTLVGELDLSQNWLSFIQQRFLKKWGNQPCNQYLLLELDQALQPKKLNRALIALVNHHDILRARYGINGHTFFAEPLDSNQSLLNTFTLDPEQQIQQFDALQGTLDIERGPMLAAAYFTAIDGNKGKDQLFISAHHMVMDGVSWRILLEDLLLAYQQLSQQDQPVFPEKTHSLTDWANALHQSNNADNHIFKNETEFWQKTLINSQPLFKNTDQPAILATSRYQIPLAQLQVWQQALSKTYDLTLEESLLVSLVMTLAQQQKKDRFIIHRESHGRFAELVNMDLSRSLGWFTSLYPQPINMVSDDVDAQIKALKEQLRSVNHGGLGYGYLQQQKHNPLVSEDHIEVMFNYLGRLVSTPGLTLKDSGLWMQEKQPEAPLTLNLIQNDDALVMDVEFDSARLSAVQINALLQTWQERLQQLAEFAQQQTPQLTPSDAPLAGLSQQQMNVLSQHLEQAPNKMQQLLPLSPLQQGLLFQCQLSGNRQSYINQISLPVSGCDSQQFCQAWTQLMARHDMLRTGLMPATISDQPHQLVYGELSLPWYEIDIRDQQDKASYIHEYRQEIRQQGFDFEQPPLWRVDLLRCGNNDYEMIFTVHHLLLDGWSNGILMADLLALYQQQNQDENNAAHKASAQFGDYLTWLQQQDNSQAEKYWRQQLAQLNSPGNVLTQQKSAGSPEDFRRFNQDYSRIQTDALQFAARQQALTLNTLLQATWALVLNKTLGSDPSVNFSESHDDALFGITVAGRPTELVGHDSMLGLFINTLPLRIRSDSQQSLTDWLQQLQQTNADMQSHGHCQLGDIQRWAGFSGEPLFDTLMVVENYPMDEKRLNQQQQGTLQFGQPYSYEFTHYPLTLAVLPGEQLQIVWAYDSTRLAEKQIEQLSQRFQHILFILRDALLTNPSQPLGQLNLLDEQQQEKWQVLSRQTSSDYPWDNSQLFTDLVRRQAMERPHAIALIHGHSDNRQCLSYGELESRSNALANLLIKQFNPQADDIIAVCCERGIDMMIGFIAALKAGAAFLPMDPDYPEDRLAYMLSDSGATLILTQQKLIQKSLLNTTVPQLALDKIDYSQLADSVPKIIIQPQQLAYVIYTSGSTGQPKGVLIPHIGLSMHVQTIGQRYGMTTDDVELLFASISFDGCIERWSVPLAFGSRLVIRDQALWSAEKTCQVLEDEGVTISCLPPSYASALLDWIEFTQSRNGQSDSQTANHRQPNLKVRSWTLGGEAFTRELYQRLQNILKPERLINGYGPTETVITPTLWDAYSDTAIDSAYAPIGTGIGERRLYVLDNDLNPVPHGTSGELYIGEEVGLARGYHRRPDLTAERFLPDPFIAFNIASDMTPENKNSSRMYRTGDRVQWTELADGRTVLDYLGRVDQQIKIRGFRVELGEIEVALHGQPEISDVVVAACETPSGKRLVAYCVLTKKEMERNDGPDWKNISARLAKDLPDYMVPSHYEILKQLPLNPAGKVDRNALPEPDWQPQELIEYSAPETEQEIVLANIWGKLLLQNSQPESKPLRISRHAHFFALGGHSLLATRMVGLLRQRGWQLSLQVLFDQPVLADCALQLVADTDSSAGIELISRSAGQLFPATSIQKRLWFVQQLNPQSSAYHMPMALNIQGQLNLPTLEQALNVLIAEQEILRTNLVQEHGDIFQKIKPQYSLEIESFTYYNEQQLRDYIAQPFDLACDALLRVAVFHSTTEARLILVQHHIISDGVATQLLLQKWLKSYQHLLSNQNLAALNSGSQTTLSDPRQQPQYADFACWQQEWLASDNAQQQLDWWIETLGQDDQTLELATDYRRGERQPGGKRIALEFSAKQLESLKQLSQQQDISVFNLLFAPWQSLMHLYTGQNTIRSGVPVAGRTLVDTHEMAGCFINTLVIGADIDTDTSLLSLAQQLAITTASAQAHQDIPFERLVEELVQSAGDRHPLYQVSFNLQYTDSSVLKDWPDANVHLFDPGTSDSQTELALDLYIDGKNPEQQVLRGFIGFDTGLYKTSSITRMANRYLKLLDTLLAQPEQPLHDINILLADEQQSLVKCNQTHKNWGEFVSIPQRIIEQGRRTPNAIAISYSAANNNDNNYQKKQLTYRQFDHRVNGLANLLREQGVTEEVPVIISLPRSLDMVLGIHAITRSGGNYVPLDYELPQERRDCIIDTAQSTLVLTSSALAEHFVATNLTVVCIDQLWQQLAENKPLIEVQPPFVNWQPKQAFYTIFTSGSTGKPKGVINHHGALENRLLWMAREYQIDNNDVLLQKTPFGFDVSVWEFFLPFITGAALAIAPPDAHREASWLRKVMDLHKVTLVHFVPSMLAEYLEAQQLSGQENIKRIICSGEALTTNHQQQVFAQHSHVELHNLYGPTEAAIDVSYWSCQREPQAGIAVPIGQAISNTQLYILDESLQQVPFGMTGELYLAGDNLARGYSQRPDLTADRFMPNPYGAPGSRMYRTGDKALRRIDGAIDYLGRLDHQVKLRGLRIELGEIEQQLNALVEIQQAVVVVDEREQSPQLAAYLVMASESENINNTAIQQRLRQYLPDYMVPNFYMAIDAIPLSANGKRDVRSLPKIEIQQRQYRAPESDIAHKLAEQWELLLKIDNVGLDDNFFALGGHSLLAVRVIAAIRNEWQVDISIRQFFASQSLEEMATLIERQVEQTQSGNEQELDEMAALLDELEGL